MTGGTQHSGMSTVWLLKGLIEWLRSVSTIRADGTLGETVGHIFEHYRTCPRGLEADLKDAQRRLQTVKQVSLVAMTVD